MRTLQSILAGTAIGVLGCNQSSPPAVVATPVVAAEKNPDEPKSQERTEPKLPGVPLIGGGSFAFPDDAGGKALAKTLTPASPPPMPASAPSVRKERVLPQYLDAPTPRLAD